MRTVGTQPKNREVEVRELGARASTRTRRRPRCCHGRQWNALSIELGGKDIVNLQYVRLNNKERVG